MVLCRIMVDLGSLHKYQLFGGIDQSGIDLIKGHLGTRLFEDGEIIIKEGQFCDKIYFLIRGSIKVLKKGTVLSTIKEGETVGEMEFLNIMPAAASIICSQATEVAVLTNQSLYEISKANLKVFSLLIMNLARDMARRLYRMDEEFATMYLRLSSPKHTSDEE